MRLLSLGITAILWLACTVGASAMDRYDPATRQLTIPTLDVGNVRFSNVVLTVGGLISGPAGTAPYASEDSYDPVSGQLTVPAVSVGTSATYNYVAYVQGLVSVGSLTGADSYDGTQLHIPFVRVPGGRVYTDVVITVDRINRVAGGMPWSDRDSYDPSSNQLTIPAVQYGAGVYTNVVVTVGRILTVGGNGFPPSGLWYLSPLTAVVGTPISPLAPTVGGSVAGFTVTPALPDGLALDPSSGVISGTPTRAIAQATYRITAANPFGSIGFGLPVAVLNPAPTLSGVSPNTVAAGSAGVTLTLQGSGFVASSSMLWDGFTLPYASWSTTSLAVAVPPLGLLTLGDVPVSVQNPGPGGGTAPALPVHVGGPLRASVRNDGASLDNGSIVSDISVTGRYVAFASRASNLVAGPTNGNFHVYLRDTCIGVTGCVPSTQRVSVAPDGTQGNGDSGYTSQNPELGVAISGTGRYVAFVSAATNLVAGDTNGVDDIFVRDTCIGAPPGCVPTTILASVGQGGAWPTLASVHPAISRSGRFVAFASNAANLVAGDTNNAFDVFLRDTCAGAPTGCVPATSRVSLGDSGNEANSTSFQPAFSGDERYLAFSSSASNLVAGDSNTYGGIYLRDTCYGAPSGCVPSLVFVSVAAGGGDPLGGSVFPKVSLHGRYVAFISSAANLVAGDTNTVTDLFVRDTCIGAPAGCVATTIRASVTDGGTQAGMEGASKSALSDDGRYAAFQAGGSAYLPTDPYPWINVLVRDTCIGADAGCVPSTKRVSVAFAGTAPDNVSIDPALSGDGRYVTFTSYADNLVPGGTTPTGYANVYVTAAH